MCPPYRVHFISTVYAQRFRVGYFLAEKALNILKFVGKSVILLVYKSIVHGLKNQEDFTKTKMLGGNDNV